MNQHLQKFLGYVKGKPFNPQERMEFKRVKKYEF
jgi:signal transduction histidine kinase